MPSPPVRRNTLVLIVVVVLLAIFAWAGWANWEYRQQAARHRAALAAAAQSQAGMQGVLIPEGGGLPQLAAFNGKPAPAFTLPDLAGKKVSLADFRGKALLINFWATWCGPCQIETPWLVELNNKYASKGFEVLGIDSEGDDAKPGSAAWEQDKAAVQKFAARKKISYPVLLNGDSISKEYGGLDDLPTSFFVDRKGKIVAAMVGIDSESDIEGNIKKALAN